MKRNAIKKVNEDYKRNCQAIPEEPKNDKVFSYGTKFKKYNEYKNEIVATTYNGFMKLPESVKLSASQSTKSLYF